MNQRRLVLFDIDGTLITDGGASRDAFAATLNEVYGYPGEEVNRYDFSGRTDPQIAFMVLRDAGFSDEEIESKLPAMWRGYVEKLERNATPQRVRALPGIIPLLKTLSTMEHITLGLLTGNIEPGARVKLTPPSLNE